MCDGIKRISVLMAVCNRREITRQCLYRVLSQMQVARKGEDRSFDFFVVDDGSKDGTSEAIKKLFNTGNESNSRLHLISGTGSLYWAKGMELAWQMAIARESIDGQSDGYLWLNDDAMLFDDAFGKLKSADDGESLIVGQLVDATGKEVYGLNVNGWVNGNFVYVPHKVYEKVGMICGEYAHAWADSDYAMRCKKAGVAIKSCGVVGATEWHELRPSLKGRDLRWRWRTLFDPKGWNLHDLWLYRRRNRGFCAAVLSSIHFVLHVLFGRG